MKTGPAISLWVAGLLLAGLLLLSGQPSPAEPPQLSTLLPPLLDRLGSLAVEWLQWLAVTLGRD